MLRAGHQRADSVLTRACRACILINPFPRGGSQVWAGVARGSKVTPLGSSKADVQTFRTKEPRCRLGQPVLVTHLGIQVPLRAPIKNAEVGFPGGSVVKNLPANARDMSLNPGSGRSPGERNGNPLQYSCPGNPMNRGAWWTTVHGVTKESDMT